MQVYLVGGAVRDHLLGLPVADRDWVVVGATPETLLDQGFTQLDPDFPVFLHPQSGEEYALARREVKVAAGFRGFEIDSSPEVTLEDDLRRRDLTINAIAQTQDGLIIDPFGGQGDLRHGFLRHVSPAFSEDPVRLLRVARFAARFGVYGFRLTHDTHHLMEQMVENGAMGELKAERAWQEMQKALEYQQPWRFFEVLNACGGLSVWLPRLADEMKVHNNHDSSPGCTAVAALKRVTELTASIEVRLAALLIQTGDSLGLLRKNVALSKAGTDLVELTQRLWPAYQTLSESNAVAALDFLSDCRAWQNPARFKQVLLVLSVQQKTDEMMNKLERASLLAGAVKAVKLQAEGLSGKALGEGLQKQRQAAIETIW